jgi:hypothetical protein
MDARTIPEDTQTLVVQYLNVVNTALDRHREDFPYNKILSLSQRVLAGKNIGMGVYKGEAKSAYDYYTLSMDDGRLRLVSHGKTDADLEFKARLSYLEEVVENDAEYIEHPVKLDWEWLKTRLGIS